MKPPQNFIKKVEPESSQLHPRHLLAAFARDGFDALFAVSKQMHVNRNFSKITTFVFFIEIKKVKNTPLDRIVVGKIGG